jgi:hypothetical protein
LLGRDMSIAAANSSQLVFTLPTIKNPVKIANQSIAVTAFGALSQVDAAGGQHTFHLNLAADLTDLQQNATSVLRAQLNRADSCGQRIDIRQASLMPSPPASLMTVRLHFERWTCVQVMGQPTATELAEGDGSVEIKLTPAVESHALKLSSEFSHIDATGMLGDSLRSGSLGEDLRGKVAESVLFAMESGTDFKLTLPPAARESATLQGARFEDAGAGILRVVLDGQVQLSDDQTKALASQLKEILSAEESTPR